MLQVWHGIEKFLQKNVQLLYHIVQARHPRSEFNEDQEHGDTTEDDGEAKPDNMGLLKHGHQNQEATNDEKQDGKYYVDSYRSLKIWLLQPEMLQLDNKV